MHAIPWAEFVRAHLPLSRQELLTVVEVPHLLIPWSSSEEGSGDPFFTTERLNRANLLMGSGFGGKPRHDLLVAPLRKRERGGNAFTGMITLGRAENNDLVLAHPGVSKFHAYFRRNDDGWTLRDANSLNGTAVNGEKLAPETERTLSSGAVIRLADAITLEFLAPDDLFTRLHADQPLSVTARQLSSNDALPTAPADPARATRVMPRGPLLDPDEETHPLLP